MKLSLVTLVLVCLSCSAPPDGDEVASSAAELAARVPIPFALQFVGTYEGVDAGVGTAGLRALELRRNGRYVATLEGGARRERGVFAVTSGAGLPLELRLTSSAHANTHVWTATVRAYDGVLGVTKGSQHGELRALGAVGPNEEVCDRSGGSWTDDDVDPATGLYCLCPNGRVYIPSHGGCVP